MAVRIKNITFDCADPFMLVSGQQPWCLVLPLATRMVEAGPAFERIVDGVKACRPSLIADDTVDAQPMPPLKSLDRLGRVDAKDAVGSLRNDSPTLWRIFR